jgi:hypothetical protein
VGELASAVLSRPPKIKKKDAKKTSDLLFIYEPNCSARNVDKILAMAFMCGRAMTKDSPVSIRKIREYLDLGINQGSDLVFLR